MLNAPALLMRETLQYGVPWADFQLAWKTLTDSPSIRPMVSTVTSGAYHVWQDKLAIMVNSYVKAGILHPFTSPRGELSVQVRLSVDGTHLWKLGLGQG